MAKLALLVIVIFGFAYGDASIAQGHKQVGKGSNGAQATKSDQRGTDASPLVVNERTIHSDEEAAENARKEAEQNHTNSWIIGLTAVIAICAGLQFLGIVVQIFVYFKQTTIMQRTLAAIEKQTGIQTAAMQQWVEFNNWKSDISGKPGDYILAVTFELVNTTNLLLTISSAEVEIQTDSSIKAFLVRKGTPLPPKMPISVTLRVPISNQQWRAWINGTIGFGIGGEIVFISALKQTVTQSISGLITCSYSSGAKLESVVSFDTVPTKSKENNN